MDGVRVTMVERQEESYGTGASNIILPVVLGAYAARRMLVSPKLSLLW